jgi:hypothetical protein
VASLEERVQLLEDERSILHTMHTYAHSLDQNLEEEFVDCWTDDARLYWSGMQAEPFVGRDAIAQAFRSHAPVPGVVNKHLTLEPRLTMEGGRATGVSYFAFVVGSGDGDPRIQSYGSYRDVFVRCDDGRWRFQERRPEVEAKRA